MWLLGAPLRWAILAVVLVYRGTFGHLFAGRCRFHPSCSAYAVDAIRTHGALKGVALAAWRVARCSPLTAGGPDPVPRAGTWRSRSVV
jgi:hypothetical protein